MSWLDEPILRRLRIRKQSYRLGMAIVCGVAANAVAFSGRWWGWLAIPLAIVAIAKLNNWAISTDPEDARYGD